MRIGFGVKQRTVEGAHGGGGHFSALLKDWLIKRGHQVYFNLNKGPHLDVIFDAAHSSPLQRIQKYQKRGTPTIYRMDGMGGIIGDRPLYTEKCTNADCVVYQSKFAQRCTEHFTKAKKSVIIYNGVLMQPDISTRPHEKLKILTYCRPQKSWGRQLGTTEWNEVLEKYQDKFGYEIVSIGKVNTLPRGQLLELMKTCDIFIHTAYYEVCSNALLEAMSCGCAVLSTDEDGSAEIVGKEGCQVKTRPATRDIDYSEFTHKDCDFLPIIEMDQEHAHVQLSRCIANLQHFKQYSLSRIQSCFNIERQAQAYFNLMKELADG